MQYCRDHPEEVSRLSRVKAQVDQVKGIMMENIDKVIDRGEQIDGLVTRTEQLHNQVCVCYLVFCSFNCVQVTRCTIHSQVSN